MHYWLTDWRLQNQPHFLYYVTSFIMFFLLCVCVFSISLSVSVCVKHLLGSLCYTTSSFLYTCYLLRTIYIPTILYWLLLQWLRLERTCSLAVHTYKVLKRIVVLVVGGSNHTGTWKPGWLAALLTGVCVSCPQGIIFPFIHTSCWYRSSKERVRIARCLLFFMYMSSCSLKCTIACWISLTM